MQTSSSNSSNVFLKLVYALAILLALTLVTSTPAQAQLPATGVLGQSVSSNPSFTQGLPNNGSSTASQLGFNSPTYTALDSVGHRLFVSDTQNNRVLVFILNSNNIPQDLVADYVIGQTDFTSGLPNKGLSSPTAGSLNAPTGLLFVNNQLYVADTGNNRVLVFSVVGTIINGTNAFAVLGQSTFTFATAAATQSGMRSPQGLAYNLRFRFLMVADTGNNRIMLFNAQALQNGANANYVWGQSSFTASIPGTTDRRYNQPTALFYDEDRELLFITDTGNHRVLILLLFDRAAGRPLLGVVGGVSLRPASYVLGQSDFNSGQPNMGQGSPTPTGLNAPKDIQYDKVRRRVFVSDSGNHRIVGFDANLSRITNGENAFLILGQADYTQSSSPSPPTASSLNNPVGLQHDMANVRLYTIDSGNHRVLFYNLPQITTTGLASATNGVITQGASYDETLNVSGGGGTYTFSLTSGSLPTGLTLTSGTLSGTPTAPGIFCFTTRVQDQYGLSDEKEYYLHIKPASGSSSGLVITTPYLPYGPTGYTYGMTLTASGGQAPYRWSATGLPPNFIVNTCSGRLEADHLVDVKSADYTVNVTVVDLYNNSFTQILTLSMVVASPTCISLTTELPDAIVGQPYKALVKAIGCASPYNFTINVPPGLPPGLVANDEQNFPNDPELTDGVTMRIEGIPTQVSGTFPNQIKFSISPHHCEATVICDGHQQLILVVKGADSQPPTTPGNLTANATGTTSINLTWAPSTDNIGVTGYKVERCQGAGCTSFSQIATTAGTSYTDTTGLSANTTYTYRVRATDGANDSTYSNPATATTFQADTTKPSPPANLTATATSGSQINLTWTASTDNIGVTGYRIRRCQGVGCSNFAQVAAISPTTTYSDTGLTSATSYSYQVTAVDAANNESDPSNTQSATTLDTTAPTAPSNLTANASSSTQIDLNWTASTDNVGVTGYQVERCPGQGCTTGFTSLNTVTGTSYNDTAGLAANTTYGYRVRAVDAATNPSNYSNISYATTLSVADFGLSASPASGTVDLGGSTTSTITVNSVSSFSSAVGLTCSVSPVEPTAGCILNPTSVTPPANSNITSTLTVTTQTSTPLGNYTITITGTSGSSHTTTFTLTVSDTAPPSAPTNVQPTLITYNQVNLTWTASTDNIGVTGYRIERCAGVGCTNFNPVSTSTTTSYNDTEVAASTTYNYRVRALDAANNVSDPSTPPATALTPAAPDFTIAASPTSGQVNPGNSTPSTITLTSSNNFNSAINLTCSTSHSTVGCSFNPTSATPTPTQNASSTLTVTTQPATSLGSYTITITGTSGSLSHQTTFSLTVSDTIPPTAPTNLAGQAVSSSQIDLSWTASTDNVGVASYQVERCQGNPCTFAQIGTTTTTNYNDTGLSANTTYSYRVRAVDGSSLMSNYSNVVNAITPPLSTSPPNAPTNLLATAVSSSSINLSWTDNSTDETGFRIERSTSSTSGFIVIKSTFSNTITYSDVTGLNASTTYYYRVYAFNVAGDSIPATGFATTLAPPLTITSTSPLNGEVGQSYNYPLTAQGGTGPYTWEFFTGSPPDGLQITGSAITGIPTSAGQFNFGLKVTDQGTTQSAFVTSLPVTILALPVNITTTSLPTGVMNQDYQTTLTATGGTGSYIWSITNGELPGGLNLFIGTNTITGIPSLPGTYNFTVHVESGGQTDDQDLSITILDSSNFAILTTILPAGYVIKNQDNTISGVQYLAPIKATDNGAKPYSWSILNGTLPAGLSLTTDPITSNGVIQGLTQTAGQSTFTVQVTDAQGRKATQILTLNIGTANAGYNIDLLTSTIPDAVLGLPYTGTIEAGVTDPLQLPVQWSIAVGKLPYDLILEAVDTNKDYARYDAQLKKYIVRANITGTPLDNTGQYAFTVKAVETHHNGVAREDLTLTVKSACGSNDRLTITTQMPSMATVGTSYETPLNANGSSTNLIWSVCQGALPDGLSINPTTRVISGTPQTEGVYNFTVKVLDPNTNDSGERAYEIVIINLPGTPPGNIDIKTPASVNRVDGFDLAVLKRAFGSSLGNGRWNVVADLNKDGKVDGSDLTVLTINFGKVRH